VKLSDIKIGYVYYVDYEPVRNGEFNGKHLSVVLKRNNDKYTFVVMPLTSSANGDGVNKINIGKIAGLPPNLYSKDTYAVFDQVRTVNANRFSSVKSGGNSIDVPMDKTIWLNLFTFAIRDMIYNIGQDEKIAALKSVYDRENLNKALDLAYNIIKLRKSGAAADEKIAAIKNEIRETLKYASYTLDAKQTADGIQKIFDEALNN
jgi:mRNA-degrading endonuclease toxin of MazEF toxin-antitoxin module